ncbi:cAMP-binding domain of CRP or a regulatory subunit of cAMP-dependent protein kinases [Methylobacterium sp. UNC378MF]|uniref:Crp/Fnr family transcriptional regulator n=1 Tax=Methylobacterium sp. UNC378MF TaxID=1502748 RepID=UPI00088DF6D9|nr:Crp/Fnr family transcriptional regulator [Methylobacterium sp. UNC378MF]SDA33106.1 cAMP-binding domain of CRP or a regulatory subunit of cAMP-dependent protein kinases [Methylobacterium sp. UNC378MF]
MPSAPIPHATTMLVRKLESIATLSDEERQAIERLPVRINRLDGRHDIVRDGDKPSHCCLILDGWACRYKLLSQGKRQILSFHIAGDIPDLQSLHIHTMDHSLATVTKATLAFIPHENLRELTAQHPGIAALLWRNTLIDAGIFREWMIGIGRRSAFERIGHLFCEMYLKLQAVGLAGDYRCPMPITQTDFADALGLTSVHVNRVLKDMRGQTLITLRSHTLVIEAWDELMRVSEFDPTYLHLEQQAA